MKLGHEALTLRWSLAARAFNQRVPRERVLLITAAAVLLLWLAHQVWLDAQWQRWHGLRQQQGAAAMALQTLQDEGQRQQLQQQTQRQQWQAEVKALRERLAAQAGSHADGTPRSGTDAGLIGPQDMLPLLSQLLGRQHGLRVRTLQSLGQSAVNEFGGETRNAKTASAANEAPAAASAAAQSGAVPLYRHGVELSVEGSYADLVSYLQTLEALPQKLLWGSLQLKVEQYPQVLLTLRVYTLSQQAGWVEL